MPGQFERYVLCQLSLSLPVRSFMFADFKPSTPRNFRPSNQTRNFAGCLISARFTWSSSSRIERLRPTWHHWKLLSLSFFQRKVKQPPCLHVHSNRTDALLIDVWSLDGLIPRVGSVDRSSALKALVTWVDLGVLKENSENSFQLLEVAEEATPGTQAVTLRPGAIYSAINISFIHLPCLY